MSFIRIRYKSVDDPIRADSEAKVLTVLVRVVLIISRVSYGTLFVRGRPLLMDLTTPTASFP